MIHEEAERIKQQFENPIPAENSKSKQNVPAKDGYSRMNFLHQAAVQIVATQPQNVELARYYMKSLRRVKEKKVLRWSREMKRSICNGCNMVLISGITSQVRIRGKRRIVMTCLSCNTVKRSHTVKPSDDKNTKKKKRRERRRKKKENP